jgi:hypothetical protein
MKTELFDRTLKQLVDFDPQNWASLTGLPSVVSGVPLSPELAATHQRVDALLSITMPDGAKPGPVLKYFVDASYTPERDIGLRQHYPLR